MRGTLLLVMSMTMLCLVAVPTRAEIYNFTVVENNSGIGDAIAPQFTVDVTEYMPESNLSPTQVLFTFSNTATLSSSVTSSITDVYFDDGALLGIANLLNTAGVVEFSAPANPSNLPGGETLEPDFVTGTAVPGAGMFSADADSATGTGHDGIDLGESLGVVFFLVNGADLSDVLASLNNGDLRIGLKVQGIDGNGGPGDSYVNVVPVPAAVLLGMLGMGVAGLKLRKFV